MFLEGDPSVASLKAMQRKFNISNTYLAPFPPLRPEDYYDENELNNVVDRENIQRRKLAKIVKRQNII